MIDLLTIIGKDTQLRKAASTNGGEWCGPCPFCGGRDRFRVWPNASPKPRWWCRQCRRKGDAIDYLQERDGLTFREAKEALGIEDLGAVSHSERQPKPQTTDRTEPPPDPWQEAAQAVIATCQAALWAGAGVKAREWLGERGLEKATLRAWQIGYNPTDRELHGLWVDRGVVIPCQALGATYYLKVRRPVPPLSGPKYKVVKGSRLALFGLDHLAGLQAAAICEGELDGLLLWQLAGDLVDVVAVGGANQRPASRFLLPLARSSRWLVALDRDAAGQTGAEWWGEFSARVRQVQPVAGNDLTDFHKVGGDLRTWVSNLLQQEGLTPVKTLGQVYAEADALLARCDGSPEWYRQWARMEERLRQAEGSSGRELVQLPGAEIGPGEKAEILDGGGMQP